MKVKQIGNILDRQRNTSRSKVAIFPRRKNATYYINVNMLNIPNDRVPKMEIRRSQSDEVLTNSKQSSTGSESKREK